MKTSELIEKLSTIIKNVGDLEVVINDWDGYESYIADVDISVNNPARVVLDQGPIDWGDE